MKSVTTAKSIHCFLLIFLCFLWTSSGYLSWLYGLIEFMPGSYADLIAEVTGYLLQAAGLLAFALMVRKNRELAGSRNFTAAAAADLVFMIAAILSDGAGLIIFGFLMNFMHGIVAGFYLHRLAIFVRWDHRSIVFGFGYAAATLGTWLLSLIGEGNFLASDYVCPVYCVMAALTVILIMGEKRLPAESLHYESNENMAACGTAKLIALAGITVVMLSLVKNLGFTFSAADIELGIDLELSRLFYALGLVIAGVVGDMERRYGAVLCVASLSVPFIMMAFSGSAGPSLVFWALNYFLFGFFTVFRVVLFSDIARKSEKLLYLACLGLMFGRLGDAGGVLIATVSVNHLKCLAITTAVLFAVTIILFSHLFQLVYQPAPIQKQSEQDRFDEFSQKYELSLREREVMKLILEGRSNPEIAGLLYISESTVKYHIHNLLKKTGCENRVSLLHLYRLDG